MTQKAFDGALVLLCFFLAVSIAGINISLAVLTVLAIAVASGLPLSIDRLRTPILYALLGYLAVGMISALFGAAPSESVRPLIKDAHKVWAFCLLALVLGARPSPQGFRPLAAGFSLIAVFGIVQAIVNQLRDMDYASRRAHAFVHPVTYGELMCFAVLGSVCFFNREEAGTHGKGMKAVGAAFGALVGLALILNQTRGALAGLAAGAAALMWLDKRARRLAIPAIVALILAVLSWRVVPTRDSETIRMIFKGHVGAVISKQFADRKTFWRVGWKAFLDHPFTGVGPGNYRTVFPRYFTGIIEGQSVWGSAHNLYIHQLAERGALGAFALLALLGALTARAYQRAQRVPNPWNLWAFGAVVSFLVMNVTEVAFQNEQIATVLIFIWCWAEANDETAPADAVRA
ncbi:MAG: O-antigen ligase family protein [Elusimicrobia bacterium]|nr:O-antigen ligase family protein [Elusimicrobiota bacterium]